MKELLEWIRDVVIKMILHCVYYAWGLGETGIDSNLIAGWLHVVRCRLSIYVLCACTLTEIYVGPLQYVLCICHNKCVKNQSLEYSLLFLYVLHQFLKLYYGMHFKTD